MKIFMCCSKHFYDRVAPIKKELEQKGNVVTLPNSYENPFREEELKKTGKKEHAKWKSEMLRKQAEKISENDAVLILNFDKHRQKNYIGGATFLEIYKAFELGKKIYFMNPIPEGMLMDELSAMEPMILNGDISLVR